MPFSAFRDRNTLIILGCMATYNVGTLALWLQPAIVSEFITQRGLPTSTAGLIATAEMVIMSVTMMLWARFALAMRYRTMALLGVGLCSAAAIGCLLANGALPLLSLRVVAAVGFGILFLVPSMAMAALPNVHSAYARMYAVSLVASSAVLAVLPWLTETLGRPPAFPAFLLYAALLLPGILLLPRDAVSHGRTTAGGSKIAPEAFRTIALLTAGLSVLALAYFEVWAFFLMLAGKAGLTPAQANTASAISLLGAIAGSVVSAPLAKRIGGDRVMLLAAMGISVNLLLLIGVPHPVVFRVCGCLVLVSFYMLFPAVLGTAAEVDPTGKGVAVSTGLGMMIGAAGPYLGGMIIASFGYKAMMVVTAIAMILSLIFFGIVSVRSRRTGPVIQSAAAEQIG